MKNENRDIDLKSRNFADIVVIAAEVKIYIKKWGN